MYFTGARNTVSSKSIGVAFSKDMLHWQEYPENPIMTPGPGPYDSLYVRSGTVLFHGHSYQMWYTGAPTGTANFDVAIDYANSSDGIHWTKYAGNPVMTDKGGAGSPSVVEIGGSYLMVFNWFYITDATSPDGIHWSWYNTELLNGTGVPSDWEGTVEDPSFVISNYTMLLWFTGYGFYTPPQLPAPNPAIGLAYCPIVVVPTTVTTTLIRTTMEVSTSAQTIVTTAHVTVTSPGVADYQVGMVILGAAAVAFAILAFRKSR
jgi:hypothetical protein